jgi:hypothetical protein
MKSATLFFVLLIAGLSCCLAQSNSFQALSNKFSENEGVHTFKASGFLARSVLRLAGERDFARHIDQVRNIRLISIPKTAFEERAVSVPGFKKVVSKDNFEELARARDQKDQVNLYIQTNKKPALNRYLILIDNPDGLVAVEIKGYINPATLQERAEKLSYDN